MFVNQKVDTEKIPRLHRTPSDDEDSRPHAVPSQGGDEAVGSRRNGRAPSAKTPLLANRAITSPPRLIVDSGTPFDREVLWARVVPFAIVAGLATASIALPPGPSSVPEAIASIALLIAVAVSFFLPWERIPAPLTVFPPLVYIGSALLLILSEGTTVTGVGIILLIPVVWTALYHRPWESVVVVAATGAAQIVTSFIPVTLAPAVTVRKVAFWILLSALISVATHALRAHVRRNAETREARFRHTKALVLATEELTTTLEPEEVLTKATALAAELVSPPGTRGRRAQYLRVDEEGVVSFVAEYDETGGHVATTFALEEHPNLERAVRTRNAFANRIDPSRLGPNVRELVARLGVTYGVYVPVVIADKLDGVLTVSVRGTAVPGELVEQCKALGHIVELALSNARAHEELRDQAVTDILTGLRNRRGFEYLVANRPGRSGFAILVLDVDGLKRVNDEEGHAAGDALLVQVGAIVSGVLRRGDVLARIGGDEFAAYLFDAAEKEAKLVAERILAALRSADESGALSVSIGIAVGSADDDAVKVRGDADEAMYRAKRSGGRRYELENLVSSEGWRAPV
jgi:diguanylate cyclase (GGDEF)-like protein